MAQGEQEQGPLRMRTRQIDGGIEAVETDHLSREFILGAGGGSYISPGPVCRQKRSLRKNYRWDKWLVSMFSR